MAMKRLDDRDLITEYLKGNEKAFEVLLMRHKDKIFRFIHLKLRDRVLAEDVFQETFVKIINTLKLGSYNEEGKFLPWAMRIAHNLVIDHFRKASKVRMISESSSSREDFNIFDVLSLTDKNIEQKITYDELEKQMVDLIEFLPATQKEILKMRIFQDMSFKD
ncbi:MAG: sigma-70 family RNA polymerase sigma factor, partial [Crocinitomicaceae bacterium]|nr:sigma-70 family RNA polymerase sigma factor [Crocinitomicaceae bacterium]